MEIIIHARQAQLADDFKGIVKEKLKSMDRFHVLMERVEVEIIHIKLFSPREVPDHL